MRIPKHMLNGKRTRQGLRVVILCALTSVTLVSYVSWGKAKQAVGAQAQTRLTESNKAVGMALFEQLLLADMEFVAHTRRGGASELAPPALIRRIVAFEEYTPQTGSSTASRMFEQGLQLTDAERTHLGGGKALLRAVSDGSASRLVMVHSHEGGYLAGEVDLEYLWRVGALAGPGRDLELLLMTAAGEVMFSTQSPVSASLSEPAQSREGISGFFAVDLFGQRHLGAYRQLPLRFWFGSEDLIVVTAEPREGFVDVPRFLWENSLLVGLLSLWGALLVTASRPGDERER